MVACGVMRAFVLRHAVVTAYATCRSLRGARTGTMFDWQWDLAYPAPLLYSDSGQAGPRASADAGPPGVRPLQPGQDPLRLLWVRQVVCFAVAHGVTGVVEADVEEESDEAEEDGSEREESEDDTEEESEEEGEEDEEEESEEEEESDGEEDEDMEDDED